MSARRPVGVPTRGTTAAHRLVRVDRWLVATLGPLLRSAADPLVVDLGFGASPVTTVEMHARLRARIRPDVDVIGLELDPARVAAAKASDGPGLEFRVGGFELPVDGRQPMVVRALNVLRQYDVADVESAWQTMGGSLAGGGVLVDGTCDEVGRRAAWVALRRGRDGRLQPESLTLSAHLGSLERPGELAERLPKVLIHRNVPGERVHDVLARLDRAWAASAGEGVFGARQRWVATVARAGLPTLSGASALRRGEVSYAWDLVRP